VNFFWILVLFLTKYLTLVSYNSDGDAMTIYLDLLFLINFIFDFLILLVVNVALKRYTKIYKLILASLFGGLSLLFLFININNITLSILKVLIASLMVLISFGYKNVRYVFYNLLYFYMVSIILGGFLYYLKIEFSYDRDGLVFFYKGLSFSYLVLIVISPLILLVFIKSLKVLREVKNYYYKVDIKLSCDFKVSLTGFLDTGNRLIDPITNKPIILLNKRVLKGKYHIRSPMYVPFNSLNNHGLLECVKPISIYINDKVLDNYLIGFSDKSFKLNGIDCLLNYKILEDIC